jgi:hypothetical protein
MLLKLFTLLLLCASCRAQYVPGGALVSPSSSGAIATFAAGAVGSAASTAATAPGVTVSSGQLVVVVSKSQSSALGGTVVISSTGVTCPGSWIFPTNVVTAPINPTWISTFSTAVAYCVMTSGGTLTATATWSGLTASGFTDIDVAVFTPGGGKTFTGTILDQVSFNGNTGAAGTTCASGTTATTTNSTDLVVGVCHNFNTAQTYTAASGYTLLPTASRNTTSLQFLLTAATGTQTFSTTVVSDIVQGWVVAVKLQ